MHYIRYLKPPKVGTARGITSKITVTTDLGEFFLAKDIILLAYLEDQFGNAVGSGKSEVLWRGSTGMRALEAVLPLPGNVGKGRGLKMVVKPKDDRYALDSLSLILGDSDVDVENGENGRVVAVRSMSLDLSGGHVLPTDMVERVFTSRSTMNEKVEVCIWEETGESIARHIWDAGLVLSSYLAHLYIQERPSPPPRQSQDLPRLPKLKACIQSPHLRVLELGAGCGIVGLTLASHHPSLAKLVLTDLPEASSILTHNISHHLKFLPPSPEPTDLTAQPPPKTPPSPPTHHLLDWHLPLPKPIASVPFDLILLADCTYNPDVVPSLAKTLHNLIKGKSRDALVCVAMKVRHESEMVFFELMAEKGFVVVEKGRIGLPVLGDEGQEIEIFVFGFEGRISRSDKQAEREQNEKQGAGIKTVRDLGEKNKNKLKFLATVSGSGSETIQAMSGLPKE